MKIKTLDEFRKDHLLAVLEKTSWDLGKTANLLKISRQRLETAIRDYDLGPVERDWTNDR